jgi:hypothetical protein
MLETTGIVNVDVTPGWSEGWLKQSSLSWVVVMSQIQNRDVDGG